MTVDGQTVDRWRVDPVRDWINFFRVVRLLNGIPPGPGNYATLTISARAEQPGVMTPQVAVEQFNIQAADVPMFGFADGWQEAEYKTTGRSWRWTSDGRRYASSRRGT